MAKANRWILEGEWSGYHSGQRRVVHRQVFRKPADLSCIRYTDGTTLNITIRKAKKGERVKEIYSYLGLIREALALGKEYVTVEEMNEKCYEVRYAK